MLLKLKFDKQVEVESIINYFFTINYFLDLELLTYLWSNHRVELREKELEKHKKYL